MTHFFRRCLLSAATILLAVVCQGQAMGMETEPQTISGGQGQPANGYAIENNFSYLSYPENTVLTLCVTYDMYSEPDRLQVIYGGSVVADTNGLVSGAGAIYVSVPATLFGGSWTIKVVAPSPNTQWTYTTYVTDASKIDSIQLQVAVPAIDQGASTTVTATAYKNGTALVPQPQFVWAADSGFITQTTVANVISFAASNSTFGEIPIQASAGGRTGKGKVLVNQTMDPEKYAERSDGNESADPIRYANGDIDLYVDDLQSGGFAPMSLRRSYAGNQQLSSASGILGPRWAIDTMPFIAIRQMNGKTYAALVRSGIDQLVFLNTAGIYSPLRYNREILVANGNDLLFTETDGDRILFHSHLAAIPAVLRGKIRQSVDAAGNATGFDYDAAGRLLRQFRIGDQDGVGVMESFDYQYYPDGKLAGASRSVVRNGGTSRALVRQVTYDYYSGAVGEFGENGELRLVLVKDAANNVLSRYHYRYWRAGDVQSSGVPVSLGALKQVISTGAYDRMVQAGGDPLAHDISAYATKFWEYDANGRVVKQVLRGNEVDGTGTQLFQYAISSHADGYNTWRTKTTESLADGVQNIVYCNYAAQVLVKITRDPIALKEWVNAYRYNAIGLETWHATPSAVTGMTLATVPETDPYLGFGADGTTSSFVKTSDGLILEKVYYTANTGGGADRRLWKEIARKGRSGAPEILNEQTYLHRTSTDN